MNPLRRTLLLTLPLLGSAARANSVQRGRVLHFPQDHGAHLPARTEWWYATGWLGSEAAPASGFQVTFFRSRTGLATDNPSRFAARHLLFAHAAITQLTPQPRHRHDQRITRWSGQRGAALGEASEDDGDVRLGAWWLRREGDAWRTLIEARDFKLDLTLTRSQPLLLQGDAGFSRKGPEEKQASHYYSEPQLLVRSSAGQTGRAWLDHEWSDEILHPDAVGWDWIGMNLFDGSALTAFVLRRRDGSTLWAGGSWRRAGQASQSLTPEQVRFVPGRRWLSPASNASYPVHWQVQTSAGNFEVRALADSQELDGAGSTGAVYWEGLSELRDSSGRRVGLGYLEMTGYAARLRL